MSSPGERPHVVLEPTCTRKVFPSHGATSFKQSVAAQLAEMLSMGSSLIMKEQTRDENPGFYSLTVRTVRINHHGESSHIRFECCAWKLLGILIEAEGRPRTTVLDVEDISLYIETRNWQHNSKLKGGATCT
jgi:hypothetical protein